MIITTNEDTKKTVENFTVSNVPFTTHAMQLGSDTPDNGTATVSGFTKLTSSSGIIVATGEYEYTPDSNFNGTDEFTIDLLYGDSTDPQKLTKTVNVTINPVQDVTATTLGPFAVSIGVADVRDLTTNDTFVGATYSLISAPSKGTATVSSAGSLSYTASSSGADELIYGVTPSGGTRENVTVRFTNS